MTRSVNWQVVPGSSVGPIVLGMSELEVRRELGRPRQVSERGGIRFHSYGDLTIVTSGGLVSMIVCEQGSSIRSPKGASSNMGWADLVSLLGDLVYDEEAGLWKTDHEPGLLYEIARPAMPGEQPIDPPFVPEQYEVSDPDAAVVRRMFVQ